MDDLGEVDVPVLLTRPESLPQTTPRTLGPARIVVPGGPHALAEAVLTAIRAVLAGG